MKMIQKNTRKILNFLLRKTEDKNINQISRELKISVGSVFKILRELEKKEIVLVNNLGNAKYYNLNFKNSEAVKLCELILLQERQDLKDYAKIYADEIKKFKDAELIVLFGSVLKNKEFNDVDVLFVTNKVKKVTGFCLDISKTKSKPVSPLILKRNGLINEINKKRGAVLEIMKTGAVLKGESVFIEIMKNVGLQK